MRFIKTLGGTLINFDEIIRIRYDVKYNQSFFYLKNEDKDGLKFDVFYQNEDIAFDEQQEYQIKLNQIILQEFIYFFNKNVFGIYDIEKNIEAIKKLMLRTYPEKKWRLIHSQEQKNAI